MQLFKKLVSSMLEVQYDRGDRRSISMLLSKELDPNESKIMSEVVKKRMKLNWAKFFKMVSNLLWQIEHSSPIRQEETLFNVTKLNTVQTGVITNHPKIHDCITGPSNSKSRCFRKQDIFNANRNWSLKREETSLDFDDKQMK